MCQGHTGAHVSLLETGKTDYTACRPGKTTTYILHVVPITTHTHVRRKSSVRKEKRNEKKRKKRKEKKRNRKKERKGKKIMYPRHRNCAEIFMGWIHFSRVESGQSNPTRPDQ